MLPIASKSDCFVKFLSLGISFTTLLFHLAESQSRDICGAAIYRRHNVNEKDKVLINREGWAIKEYEFFLLFHLFSFSYYE